MKGKKMVKTTVMYGTRAKRLEEHRLAKLRGVLQLKDLQKELDDRNIYTSLNKQGLHIYS
jgi:hypothetical protein